MRETTPFHTRTAALCTSLKYKDWSGYHAVSSYDTCHEREYHAIRHAAGLLDVSPLFKYEITGSDAGRFLSRLTVRDVTRLGPGRVSYLCWCDENGKVVDDGTVTRLDEHHYRVTAAEPALAWLERFTRSLDVAVRDSTRELGALALQGPCARDILVAASGDSQLASLRFFHAATSRIAGASVVVTRTGYTGDLGYEIWGAAGDCLAVWDALHSAGAPYRLQAAGLDALDMTRVEAGFILNGVDYHGARGCPIESRKSSPFEIGLGWTVQLDREAFVGSAALLAEARRGPRRVLVGLVSDWDELESLFDRHGLPVELPGGAWRTPVPVFDEGGRNQIGHASSGTWSPILKKNLALAHVPPEYAAPGTRLAIETTVEFKRHPVRAHVVERPFYDPPAKRS